jgi:hypothetical protein
MQYMKKQNKFDAGGMAPGPAQGPAQGAGGSEVDQLLDLLTNFDPEASVGEFLEMLMGQAGAGEMPPEAAMGQQGPPMRNMPPQGAEELLMQMGQGR